MVTLRTKQISGNRQRLYLDFYPPIKNPDTGKPTRREFLELYLINEDLYKEETFIGTNGKEQKRHLLQLNRNLEPKKVKLNPLDKKHNEETFALAENIKAKRQLEIQAGNYGFLVKEKKVFDFLAFLNAEGLKRKEQNNGDKNNWLSLYQHLYNYSKGYCTSENLTEQFCNGFKEYLQTTKPLVRTKETLSNNSAVHYITPRNNILRKPE
jgi:hypothetical protein